MCFQNRSDRETEFIGNCAVSRRIANRIDQDRLPRSRTSDEVCALSDYWFCDSANDQVVKNTEVCRSNYFCLSSLYRAKFETNSHVCIRPPSLADPSDVGRCAHTANHRTLRALHRNVDVHQGNDDLWITHIDPLDVDWRSVCHCNLDHLILGCLSVFEISGTDNGVDGPASWHIANRLDSNLGNAWKVVDDGSLLCDLGRCACIGSMGGRCRYTGRHLLFPLRSRPIDDSFNDDDALRSQDESITCCDICGSFSHCSKGWMGKLYRAYRTRDLDGCALLCAQPAILGDRSIPLKIEFVRHLRTLHCTLDEPSSRTCTTRMDWSLDRARGHNPI